jgi:hypothetical protein
MARRNWVASYLLVPSSSAGLGANGIVLAKAGVETLASCFLTKDALDHSLPRTPREVYWV